VREVAVRHLISLNVGHEVRYLLIRMNDWVAQIRAIAREAIEGRLQAELFEPFAESMALILQLLEFRRNNLSAVVEAVMDRLIRPQNERYLLQLIVGDNRFVRHRIFQEAIQRPGPHVCKLVMAGLDSADAVERILAVRHSVQVLEGDDLKDMLVRKANDAYMPVRREVLQARVQYIPETAQSFLEETLFDKSYSQRDLARFYLKKLGVEDCATHYRRAIEQGRRLSVSISGLGEVGSKEDVHLVRPFLESPLRRYRLAAVIAMDRLLDVETCEPFLGRLTDDSPKVARAAQKALGTRPGVVDPEQIWSIFSNARHRHTKIACVETIGGTEAWTGLSYLIEAATDADEPTSARAEQLIMRRYNRVFTSPSPEARKRLVEVLLEREEWLNPELKKMLQQWLGGLLGKPVRKGP